MAAKVPVKKAVPKKAKKVKVSKAKAKLKYSKAQQKAYTSASRAAIVKARAISNAQGVQRRRGLAAVRSKARPGRSGKRLKPVSGIQAVIRNRSLAAQAAGYARRTQVYTFQQAAFISAAATTIANRKAMARVLARKKLKPKARVTKTSSAPKRKSPFSAIGTRAGSAAAARIPSPKPVKKKPVSKTRKAAGVTPSVNGDWITAGNDEGVENCVAVAIANHLLLHTGVRLDNLALSCLLYRDAVAKAIDLIDYQNPWKGIGLSEYGMVSPEEAQPGDIVGFETDQGSHCGVLMPGNKVISWGEIVPLESEIDEVWQVTWTVTSQ